MIIDMERSRDGYRGRYRDRHINNNNNSTTRTNYHDRSTRGNHHEPSSHTNDHNGHYSSRNPPNNGYNYRSTRSSFNSRSIPSRNGSSTHYRSHHPDDHDDYRASSSSNRTSNGNSNQSNYYDKHSPRSSSSSSSRFDRISNHREIYSPLINEQPTFSNNILPSNSLYYPLSSSPSSSSLPRDRPFPLPSSKYIDSERNRYISSSSSNYRRESSPPAPAPVSSYRNDRSMDYGSRNTNNDIYIRNEHRPPTPPSLAPLSVRGDPYGDIYRVNDYSTHSERYDIPSNRNNSSSSSYRTLSNMSVPPSYFPREQYPSDVNYRPISQTRDYDHPSSTSSRSNYPSLMDHEENFSRNSRDRNHRASYHDRQPLKRPSSSSNYNDNGPIPSKRPMRR